MLGLSVENRPTTDSSALELWATPIGLYFARHWRFFLENIRQPCLSSHHSSQSASVRPLNPAVAAISRRSGLLVPQTTSVRLRSKSCRFASLELLSLSSPFETRPQHQDVSRRGCRRYGCHSRQGTMHFVLRTQRPNLVPFRSEVLYDTTRIK